MKRVLLSLPMLGVVVLLIAGGLYSAFSGYYPEKARLLGLIPLAWGISLGVLLVIAWVRPSSTLVRVTASVALLPMGFILAGLVWTGIRNNWELSAAGISIPLIGLALLVIACLCVARFAARPAQASFLSRPAP